MSKFWALFKLQFAQQFKSRPDPNTGKKKGLGPIGIIAILAVCFSPIIIGIVVAMYGIGTMIGLSQNFCAMLVLLSQGLVFIFGLSALLTTVFTVRDADKLSYLPVSSTTIFLSKLAVAYVNEVMTSVIAILIAFVPYGLGAGAGVGFYFTLIFALVLIPVVPLLVASLVCMPISLLVQKVGKNGAMATVLKVVFFVAIMALYMWFMYSIGYFEEGAFVGENGATDVLNLLQSAIDRMGNVLVIIHPDYMLAQSLSATSFGSWTIGFVACLAECAALLTLVVAMSLPFYKRLLFASMESTANSSKRHTKIKGSEIIVKKRGVVKELAITNFKRILRDSQMGFQAFAGLIVMPLLVIIFSVSFGEVDETGLSVIDMIRSSQLGGIIATMALTAYMILLGAGTNTLGLFPVTFENKSLYMLKTLPISFQKILTSKVILATFVMLICNLITSVLMVVLLGVAWYQGLAAMVILAFCGFGNMCITTHSDLKHPKIPWTSFQQSLKNSKNTWVAMLIGLLSALGVCAVCGLFIWWYTLSGNMYLELVMWIVAAIVSGVYALLAHKYMVHDANELFEQIEA